MKKAIRRGACLVVAALSAAALANEGVGAREQKGAQAAEVKDRTDAGAASVEPARAEVRPARVDVRRASATGDGAVKAGTGSATPAGDERASFDERWLRDREGYRDGGY